jgi:hypothetical protein
MSNGKKKLIRIKISENARLLLVSFGIAFVVWVFAKAGETEEARIQVPVVVTLGDKRPDERMDVRVEPARIPVILRYPKRLERYISSENFRLQVDAQEVSDDLGLDWKSMSQPLTEKNWFANIPEASRVDLIKIGTQSNTVEVRLRWNARPAVVEPQIVGADRLPEGLQLVTPVSVTPREVWIVGESHALDTIPRDEVTSKLALKTAPINVSDHSKGNLESVQIETPPGVEVIQPKSRFAEVNFEIQEVQTIREIRNVKIDLKALNPDAVDLVYKERIATVTVFGPPSLLKQLTSDSFEISMIRPSEELPGTSKDVPLEVRFSPNVPADIKTRVTIRGSRPATVRVSYVARNPKP